MEPLKLDNTVDPVSALLALGDVIDGKRNLVVESSGSTGTPKQIELTGTQLMQNAIASADGYRNEQRSTFNTSGGNHREPAENPTTTGTTRHRSEIPSGVEARRRVAGSV